MRRALLVSPQVLQPPSPHLHQQCSLSRNFSACLQKVLVDPKFQGGSAGHLREQGRSVTSDAAFRSFLQRHSLAILNHSGFDVTQCLQCLQCRYNMLKDWCIPCPDHIIVEHDKVAPMGPTLGDFVTQGLSFCFKKDFPRLHGKFIPRNILQETDNFIVPWPN